MKARERGGMQGREKMDRKRGGRQRRREEDEECESEIEFKVCRVHIKVGVSELRHGIAEPQRQLLVDPAGAELRVSGGVVEQRGGC